jgi:hypothetical protein
MRNIGMKADLMKPALMRSALMRSALGLLSAVASASFAIGPAAAADMPGNPPPPSGYYGPPVEEGYAVPPPPAVYAYPPAPVYPYRYALPPVAYVPGPYYYARPYYGFYGPWRSRGYAPYWAGRYHGYYPLKRGFQALYLMAMLCYVLAFMSELIFRNQDAAGDRDSDLSNRSARKIGKMAGTSPAISPNLLA